MPIGQERAGAQHGAPGSLSWHGEPVLRGQPALAATCYLPGPGGHLNLRTCNKILTSLSLEGDSQANFIFLCSQSAILKISATSMSYFIMKKINKHYFYERLSRRLERHNLHEVPKENETLEIKFSRAVSPHTLGVGIYSPLPFGIRVLCPD